MILDSFNLMPSDCVISTDENPIQNHYHNFFMSRIFLYLVDALESNMRILFGKTSTH